MALNDVEDRDDAVDTPPPAPEALALLDRAGRAAREEPQPPAEWPEVSGSVMTRVREAVTPAHRLLTFAADGAAERDAHGSRTWVSSRVVTAALRRALQQPTHAPDAIDLRLDDADDDRVVGVDLQLVCAYGPDLRETAETARREVAGVLAELVGPDPDHAPADVAVEVTDVVVGDPTRV